MRELLDASWGMFESKQFSRMGGTVTAQVNVEFSGMPDAAIHAGAEEYMYLWKR